MNEATWTALAVVLTLLGCVWTWFAFRRRGPAHGMRALGFALLPAAAWLTGTMQLFVEIAGSLTAWATSLVFNPMTWTGLGLAAAAVASWMISGVILERQAARGRSHATPVAGPPTRGSVAPSVPVDDDLADIEALLKKRGIE